MFHFYSVMLGVIMLSVIILRVVMLNVVQTHCISASLIPLFLFVWTAEFAKNG